MLKIFCLFAINFFILISLFIRFFGLDINQFENEKIHNKYFNYNAIAKKTMQDKTIKGVIIVPEKTLHIIKIFRKPIGCMKINNSLCAIDTQGFVFNLKNENDYDSLITIEGDHTKWPVFYEKLAKLNLLDKIYHVHIKTYEINLWMHPGVMIQICNNLTHLKDFCIFFPQYFQKGKRIDLRDSKRIGISNIAIPTNSMTIE